MHTEMSECEQRGMGVVTGMVGTVAKWREPTHLIIHGPAPANCYD